MKIPLYKRQIERSAKPAGLVSNISVNTAAWMAPGQAVAQVGDAVQKWAFEKAELAAKTEAHNAATSLNDELTNISRDLLKSNDPGKADGEAEKRFKNAYSKHLNGKALTSKRSKALFRPTAETAWRTSLSSFRTKNDPRILKFNENRITTEVNGHVFAASNPATPAVQALRAVQNIFGGEGRVGILNSPETQMLLGPGKIKTTKKVAAERIFKDRAMALINGSTEIIQTPNGLAKLIANDPILSVVEKTIGKAKSGKIQNELFKQARVQSDKLLAAADKEITREKAAVEATRKRVTEGLMKQIIAQRTDPAIPKVVTPANLKKALDDRSINALVYKKLMKALEGRDTIYNTAFTDDILQDIYNSVDLGDLAYHRERTVEAFNDDEIGIKARDHILKTIKDAEKNEPIFQEQKKYRKLLTQTLSPAGTYTPVGKSDVLNLAETQAVERYNQLVTNDTRPQEAYYKSLFLFTKKKRDLVFQTAKGLDPKLLELLFPPRPGADGQPGVFSIYNITSNDVGKLTPERIAAAQNAWQQLAEGKLPEGDVQPGPKDQLRPSELRQKQFEGEVKDRQIKRMSKAERITIRQLYDMEIRLDVLRTFVETKNLNKQQVNTANDDPKVKDESWWSDIYNSIVGDDPTNERARKQNK